MNSAGNPIAVVTGANSGFGYATALHLARHGFAVFAGVRNPDKAAKLAAAADGLPVSVIELDVTSDSSVAACSPLSSRTATSTR
jgi:NAD(P)-dependent dehydrogenase (short-subunit alcohol dehydrogenase family)